MVRRARRSRVGAGYRAKSFEINIGGGCDPRGQNTNPGTCNPTDVEHDRLQRRRRRRADRRAARALDPVNPLNTPDAQLESPVNQGIFKSSYVLFMVGFTNWF